MFRVWWILQNDGLGSVQSMVVAGKEVGYPLSIEGCDLEIEVLNQSDGCGAGWPVFEGVPVRPHVP